MNDINKVIQDSPGGRMDDEAVAADVEGESIIVWGVSPRYDGSGELSAP